VAWIEEFLANYKGLVMAVTHDRYFLDNVAGEFERGRIIIFLLSIIILSRSTYSYKRGRRLLFPYIMPTIPTVFVVFMLSYSTCHIHACINIYRPASTTHQATFWRWMMGACTRAREIVGSVRAQHT
jgi:hypothetical protein